MGTPAVPVKKQYKVFAGLTSMTQDFGPKCTLYCFLTGRWGGRIGLVAHAPNLEAECVLYCCFTRDGGVCDHGALFCSWLVAGRLGEGVFINREQ